MCQFCSGGQGERVTTTPRGLLTSGVGVGLGECGGGGARAGTLEWLGQWGDEGEGIAQEREACEEGVVVRLRGWEKGMVVRCGGMWW